MKTLIKKDFLLLAFLNMGGSVLFYLTGMQTKLLGDSPFAKMLFYYYILGFIYFVSISLNKYDITGNTFSLFSSLPIERKKIVKARYMVIFLHALLVPLVSSLMYMIAQTNFDYFLEAMEIRLEDMVLVIGLSLLLQAFQLPLHYVNNEKLKVINIFFYGLILIIPILGVRFYDEFIGLSLIKWLMELNISIIKSIILMVALVLYGLSLKLSIKLYENKEAF